MIPSYALVLVNIFASSGAKQRLHTKIFYAKTSSIIHLELQRFKDALITWMSKSAMSNGTLEMIQTGHLDFGRACVCEGRKRKGLRERESE